MKLTNERILLLDNLVGLTWEEARVLCAEHNVACLRVLDRNSMFMDNLISLKMSSLSPGAVVLDARME